MFMGKANLRGVGESYEFTPEMLEEYFKCAEDIVYFAQNYFYIVDIDKGKHKINLYEYQKKALKIFAQDEYDGRKNCIVLLPRQMGKCLKDLTYIELRNKNTGELRRMTISDVYNMINSEIDRDVRDKKLG